MQDFEFRVYDIRQAAPSLMVVLTRDEDSARAMAERTLRETKGSSRIDVWAGRRCLFTVEAPAAVAGEGASRSGAVGPASGCSAKAHAGFAKRARNYLNP